MNSSTTTTDKNSSPLVAIIVLVAIAIASWFIWANYATKKAIRSVLKQDAALPALVMQNVGMTDKYWNTSQKVAELASKMDAIDLNNCPKDFQIAYKRHVAAWSDMARLRASNEGFTGFVKSMFTGGMSALSAMPAYDDASEKVQSSWREVERVAIEHGVAP